MKNLLSAIWKEVPVLMDKSGTKSRGQLGIVAKQSDGDPSWCAYCGVIMYNDSEKADIQTIMNLGDKLLEDQARAWFPDIKLPYRK